MDYFTQKLSAVAKIIIADLRDIANKISVLRKSLEQDGNTIRTAYESEEQQKHELPVALEVKLEKDQERERKTESDRQHATQTSIRKATWAAFCAAILYAGIAAWQTYEIRRNFRVDQRAWIKITADPGADINADPAFWTVHLSNTGKTPALKVAADFQFQFLKKTESPIFDYTTVPVTTASKPFMWVGEDDAMPVLRAYYPEGSTQRVDFGISTEERELLKNEEAWIAKNGRVTYEDAFGVKHTTTFCIPSNISAMDVRKRHEFPGMHTCFAYNSIDDN